MRGALSLMLAGLLSSVGCSEQNANHPASSGGGSASAPSFTRTEAVDDPPAGGQTATAAAAADGAGGGDAPSADTTASAAADSPPLPEVDIKTIGMHIGGGPNDRATKAPIRAAVEKELDELRKCWALVEHQAKGGTFGVDIRIPREGGTAKITDPRTGLEGKGVEECMVGAFEAVEFARPPKGVPMKLSYSIRFTPKK